MNTTTPNFEALAVRVETLENQNRWLRRAGLAMLVLGAAITVMGQARPTRTVAAESFEVRDAEGHTRATLGMEVGSPMLVLYDQSGRRRVILFVDGRGQPVLEFKDAADNSTVSLIAYADHGPGLWLSPGASKSLSLREAMKQKGGIGLYLEKATYSQTQGD
jgi:hypothetical protein